MRVHINIGSNRGDRAALIGQAVALIASAWPEATLRSTPAMESEPWGYESDNAFLNVGVMLEDARNEAPEAVLRRLLAIEREVGCGAPHRAAGGGYCDRPVDIDLIAVDRRRIDSAGLTLPHPRAALRDFVMAPLRQLDAATAEWIERLRP